MSKYSIVFVILAAVFLNPIAFADKTDLVQHIGGVFIYAKDHKKLAEWYEDKLGVKMEYNAEEKNYHHLFFLDAEKKNFIVFSLYASAEKEISRNQFMLNLQVFDLAAVLKRLRAKGVAIEKTQEYSYGSFAWFKDGEGNRIEAWQPKAP